jgi:PAS domain S-box-containing protein
VIPQVTYAGALFGAGVLAAVAAVVVLGRVRSYTQRVPLTFAATTLSAAVWATASGFAVLVASPGAARFWAAVASVGVATVATLWFVFVLSYTRYEDGPSPRVVALLAVEPGVVIGLALSDVPTAPTLAGTFGVGVAEPLVLFHGVYSAVLVLVGLAALGDQWRHSRRLYRRQVSVVVAASLVPVAAFLGSTASSGRVLGADLTPVAFGVSAVLVLVGFYRYQLFDLTPVARDAVVGELRDGVVVVDDHDRIVETNPRARRIFGVDEGALLGRSLAAVPEYGESLQCLAAGDVVRQEFTVEDGDGERFFEATASRFDGQRDHRRGHLIVLRDVTDRHDTEAEFRALIENSRDLITVLAPDGTRVYCAPSYERVLGYDPSDLVGSDGLELIHPDDRESVREAFETLCAAETGDQKRVEYRVRHADGSWRTFEAVGVNLVDDPHVQGVVVNARDVTGRRRYEQRLRVLNRVLRHDLRNEINVVQGHADLLLESNLTVEAKEHARVIRRKADTLVDLGEQTRKIDYTLHSTDGVEKPIEITAPIRERLHEIQTEFPGAIVTHDLPDEQWVVADDLIDSAVLNVVDNAIEHNDRIAPQIHVGVESVTVEGIDYVEVSVADDGPGIPESERRVFSEGTETPLSHGSGLGLWLTEWIVSRSNGHIDFEEREPRGTVVRVRLRETASGDPAAVLEEARASTD